MLYVHLAYISFYHNTFTHYATIQIFKKNIFCSKLISQVYSVYSLNIIWQD